MITTTVTAIAASPALATEARDALLVQDAVTGTHTVQVEARLAPAAPWAIVVPSGTVSTLNSIPPYPEVRLNATAGTGSSTLYLFPTGL